MGLHRVKFYSSNILSTGDNLSKTEMIIKKFNDDSEYNDINQLIEFFNITLYFHHGCYLVSWSEEDIEKYKKIVNKFHKHIGKFFSGINDSNFMMIYRDIEKGYQKNFWSLFDKYKSFDNVNCGEFKKVLNESNFIIRYILLNKKLVNKYDLIISDYLINKIETAEIILDKYLVKSESEEIYYFPKNLKKEDLIENYVENNNSNLNYFQLIINSLPLDDLRLSDKIKLKAKHKYEAEILRFFKNNAGFEYGAKISFSEEQEEVMKLDEASKILSISYSKSWIDENLDYPILLIYNFIHLFGFVDNQIRLCHVSNPKLMGIFERYMGLKGKHEYATCVAFKQLQITAMLQMVGYNKILKENGIEIIDLCKWYFEEYIQEEFGICGFKINIPSEKSTFLEKCRTLISEIDCILKQFRLWVEDKEVNHELLQISSEHIIFKNLKSLMNNKYIYPNNDDFFSASFLLCSDQSMLNCVSRIEESYSTFYELINRENIKISDFEEFQISDINWLIEHNYVEVDKNEYLRCITDKAWIINQLSCNQVVSYYHVIEKKQTIIEMIDEKIIRFDSSLFSVPEQNYLNYLFNKSEFSNGLDLRNKYIHGTQNFSEKIHENDYYIFLRVLILIILKMNDEFCLFCDKGDVQ